jgi:hypothetical protein
MGTMFLLSEVYANIYKWIEMFETGWTSVTQVESLQCLLMSTSNEKLQEVNSYGSQGQMLLSQKLQ